MLQSYQMTFKDTCICLEVVAVWSEPLNAPAHQLASAVAKLLATCTDPPVRERQQLSPA